jgi:hypothetical protein
LYGHSVSAAPVTAFAVKGIVACWKATITDAFPVASPLHAVGMEGERNKPRKT